MSLTAIKAYDIRGKYPSEVNEDLAYAVGRAIVRHLSAKNIVVGFDMRTSSNSLTKKLIEGINSEGADVINIGMCTTPMLYFAVAHYGYDGGVMVSASHSPADVNGFKLVKAGAQMIAEGFGMEEIKSIIKNGFAGIIKGGAQTEKNILQDYLLHHLGYGKEISGIKVVIDYSNGVGAISGKPLFTRLDADIIEMFEDPDGNFPNHPANPHDIKNFKPLIKRVLLERADLGIFFDGDADRAIAVDDLGRIVPMDLLTVLLAKKELQSSPNQTIYFDLRFSKSVPDLIKSAGGKTKMMRVGNPFYKKALKEEGGILAVEFSGHVMYAENYNLDDGLFAAIKIMEIVSLSKEPLSKLVDKVRVYESSEEISLEAKNPNTVFERLIASFPEGKAIELDGVYLDFPDGFISVRQSQTETQLFRVRVEAKTKDYLKERLKKTLDIIKS